ncbi:MAG TPA: phosphoribosylglycinamide formyltransferase [Steroidobacteraceae bacterium]|nr:phosphoribosylglycinamide formyltransferase [Steroidobacteraceae bacterium]
MTSPLRRPVVVLISGRGSNMRRLIECGADPHSPYAVTKVFADNPDAGGLALARSLRTETQALRPGDFEDRAEYDSALADAIDQCAPALVLLAGFMRILSAGFVRRFEGRIMNIHPSLLPKFPGLNTHARALAAQEREHGATVHFVTAELDRGPLILQGRVPVEAGDDTISLAARVLAVEHAMYPLAARWFCEDRLQQRDGRAWLDGKPLELPLQLQDASAHARPQHA